MNVNPRLDRTVSIVDDLVAVVADEFLSDGRRDARRNLVEVFEQAKTAFATAIVQGSRRERAQ
jgi:hypothetical protein